MLAKVGQQLTCSLSQHLFKYLLNSSFVGEGVKIDEKLQIKHQAKKKQSITSKSNIKDSFENSQF
jgi:hypothetical protein